MGLHIGVHRLATTMDHTFEKPEADKGKLGGAQKMTPPNKHAMLERKHQSTPSATIRASCNNSVNKGKRVLRSKSLVQTCKNLLAKRTSKTSRTSVNTETPQATEHKSNPMDLEEIKKIGDYSKPEVDDPKLTEAEKAKLALVRETNKLKNEKLEEQSEVLKNLLDGCPDPEVTKKREAFFNYLAENVIADPNKCPGSGGTVKLETLLDKKGMALYKEAIEEEKNSRSFRKAVLFAATDIRAGEPWKEQTVVWVGGPSASGKSFARDAVMDIVDNEIHGNPKNDLKDTEKMERDLDTMREGNYNLVVSIDGGIEREHSQMRQLVLQAALNKGHCGIQDLHQHTKVSVKGAIQKAALTNHNMHLVIPDTFSNPMSLKSIIKFNRRPGTRQIFSEVVGAKADTFQNSVCRMGNSRAWKAPDETTGAIKHEKITMNNTDIGCESKEYQAKFFRAGLYGSKIARKLFLNTNKNAAYIRVKNDLVYVNAETKKEATMDDQGQVVRMTQRQLGVLNSLKEEEKPTDLKKWLKSDIAKGEDGANINSVAALIPLKTKAEAPLAKSENS